MKRDGERKVENGVHLLHDDLVARWVDVMSVQRPVKAQLLREDQANPWKDEAQKWYQPPLPNAILQRLNDRSAVPAATEAELARGVTVEERLGKRAAAPSHRESPRDPHIPTLL